MLKLISHLVVLAIGAGAGIWWGVHHPTEAQNLADNEQIKISQAVALAKQNLLQQVTADQKAAAAEPNAQAAAAHLNKYQDMLQKVSVEAKNATAKAMNQ